MTSCVFCKFSLGWLLRAGWIIAAAFTVDSHGKAEFEPLKFDRVFSDVGEPASLHYAGTFFAPDGQRHKLEVWRQGGQRLKRVTDDALETYVEREPNWGDKTRSFKIGLDAARSILKRNGAIEVTPLNEPIVDNAEFTMTILDMKRKLSTRVDRSNLYKIGNFTDWFDLAHGIKYPKGPYTLTEGKRPENAPKPMEPCDWYDLIQGQRTSHICWSKSTRLPLLIHAQDGQLIWQLTQLDRKPVAVATFFIHDEGFIRNDANRDIDHD